MNPGDYTDKAMRLKAEGIDPTFEELVTDDLTVEQLADLWLSSSAYKTAANLVEKLIGEHVAKILSEGSRAVEVSGHLVIAVTGTKWEKCINEEGFWQHILAEPDKLPTYFNPNTARMGSLPPAVRDTFFEKGVTPKPEAVPRPAAIPTTVLDQKRGKEQ